MVTLNTRYDNQQIFMTELILSVVTWWQLHSQARTANTSLSADVTRPAQTRAAATLSVHTPLRRLTGQRRTAISMLRCLHTMSLETKSCSVSTTWACLCFYLASASEDYIIIFVLVRYQYFYWPTNLQHNTDILNVTRCYFCIVTRFFSLSLFSLFFSVFTSPIFTFGPFPRS